MPSHIWPHAVLPLTYSKAHSPTPNYHDASAQLHYVAVFKSLIPLLMRLAGTLLSILRHWIVLLLPSAHMFFYSC